MPNKALDTERRTTRVSNGKPICRRPVNADVRRLEEWQLTSSDIESHLRHNMYELAANRHGHFVS